MASHHGQHGHHEKKNSESGSLKVKCLVQQCIQARLQTKFDNKEKGTEAEFVEIGRGCVFFVSFLKDADESDVEKLVKALLNVKLSETDDEKHVSILDLPGDILIIPQATLGGKVKGKMVQYHGNIDKDKGRELYEKFIDLCKKQAGDHEAWKKACLDCKVKIVNGTYGIRQVYSTQTNGPYLHLVEI